MNPLSSILNSTTKKRLNILTAPTHERYESNLSRCNAEFFAIGHNSVKTWDSVFATKPNNYHLLPICDTLEDISRSIPEEVAIDLVLSQNKFGQYQLLLPLANALHCPLISLEHTLPLMPADGPGWDQATFHAVREMMGDVNVFISEMSKNTWLYDYSPNNLVIEHGVDTNLFKPGNIERKNKCLSIVNDWINRDVFCGYKKWTRIIQGYECQVYGKTPPFSTPLETTDKLVEAYQSHSIFVNTSLISPIPSVVLEAMSCGCAVVSTATCMIPEIINGENGFCSNDEDRLKEKIGELLADPAKARRMGELARQTIIDKFPLDKFVNNWNTLFEKVVYGTPDI